MIGNAHGIPFSIELLLLISIAAVQVSSFSLISPNRLSRSVFTQTNNGQSHPIQSSTTKATMRTQLYSSPKDDDDEEDDEFTFKASSCNVLGTPLQPCCTDVGGSGIGTGFYRNGYCSTGDQDLGRHTVCIRATDDFLSFSREVGNDLSTPVPEYAFPGLKDGDIWCLCAQRWAQAYNSGKAPMIFLQATHEKTLDYVPLEIMMNYAIDRMEAKKVLDDLNEQRAKLDKLL